ncbi:hypothetical protein GpartN1_g518.t1 [Galdieria partita]|uniref:Uncharacterized protein n=1 Tax=Galdieria partita TaxID=83374 RepID=A0A9C7PS69_9RHOD|nr:hypothetical protein GpartN1_g518.t1 [Galdieria partita]
MNFILSSPLTTKSLQLSVCANYQLRPRSLSISFLRYSLQHCTMQLPYRSKEEYKKHFIAHSKRNVVPICEVLCPLLADRSGKLFEFGSGVGVHVMQLASNLPHWQFQPSDMEPEFVAEIAENVQEFKNIDAPIHWDVRCTHLDSEKSNYDIALCVNLLHVTGWDTAVGLFRSASWVLHNQGILFIYGPFKENGGYNTESNRSFDESLQKKNPQFGLKDIVDLKKAALENKLHFDRKIDMPANNYILQFHKQVESASGCEII